ncbi:PIH1 domain-containing protein 1 isoform X2 [Halyomorpha halys]|uniref:PIH1 domain-containing protein 1 isoform X2 n=1 Tax=Halyomorpha halys TaxID=286706 RepID=UPI0006D5142D|nr:PIH1 domain-containing protein 1 isoform X2 [Halyomorpha halys]
MQGIGEEEFSEEAFSKFFTDAERSKPVGVDNGVPWKRVVPAPGLCVKMFTPEGDKVFVNICHTPHIPAPKDITDEELIAILESDDPSSYRIGMSIADEHKEPDKSGDLCSVYDVAIHSSLIDKIEKNQLFRVFFMTIVVEGIQQKYNININMGSSNPFIVMKNRKVLGTLRPHRIQQRDVKPPPSPIIQEVSSSTPSTPNIAADPKLKLELHPGEGDPQYLLARVRVKVSSEKDINLDVGEDRLVISSTRRQEPFVDIFFPYNIDQSKTTAEYSRANQELKIHMPLVI